MKYTLEIKDEARKEIIEAYVHYESEQPELGERFLTQLDNFFAKIKNNPGHYPERRPPYREALLQVFPNRCIIGKIFQGFKNPFLVYRQIHGISIKNYLIRMYRKNLKKIWGYLMSELNSNCIFSFHILIE